jgi:DNA replication protein DnaC
MELNHQLTPKLKQLRLSGVLATLEARHRQAIEGQWAYVEFLERLLEDEVERRAQKPLARRVRRAALKTTKTLEGFDWRFHPTINRQQVLHLASGEDHPPDTSRVDLRADGRGQTPSRPSPRP